MFFLLQLLVSLLFLLRDKSIGDVINMIDWKNLRLYPVPSLIYLIHNNVQFGTLIYVDTSTYQIMGNLKIVTTGILFRCFHQLTLFFHFGNDCSFCRLINAMHIYCNGHLHILFTFVDMQFHNFLKVSWQLNIHHIQQVWLAWSSVFPIWKCIIFSGCIYAILLY